MTMHAQLGRSWAQQVAIRLHGGRVDDRTALRFRAVAGAIVLALFTWVRWCEGAR